ncbi:tol-pal system protein YbgF [Amorphus coralli]|uniref:tol-pal system protein YbgF n=1 Tax=Amorphus coralli TaxID=340680 RepID=UPI0004106FA6|nr:tol-pal system protein YbgF [Amorphus coralli]
MIFARTVAAAAVVAAALSVSPAMAAPDGLFQQVQWGSGNRQQGELTLRISRLEDQIRQLNGQIEQMAHQMRQMQDQMRRMQEDNEFRLQQLEGGQPRRQNFEGSAPSAGDTQRDAGLGDPQTTGSIGSSGPLDLSALARGDVLSPPSGALPGVPTYDAAPSTSATAEYEAAYSLVMAGRYGEAESAFRNFMAAHPEDPRVGDAQFWVGEALLQSGQHSQAAEAFLKSYTDYPDGEKAPDSLLKLGIALSGMGEGTAACSSFSELLQSYPAADPSLLDRARQERQRAGCA